MIHTLQRVDSRALARAGEAGRLGTGGMVSKLKAARKAAHAGIATVIADGRKAGTLSRVLDIERDEGTLIVPHVDRLARRKHWIAFTLKPRGMVYCDPGAAAAIRQGNRSLLPSGVTRVEGRFRRGDCITLAYEDGSEFARGLSTYAAEEALRIAGKRSKEVGKTLGYELGDALVRRDDLVLLEDADGGERKGRT